MKWSEFKEFVEDALSKEGVFDADIVSITTGKEPDQSDPCKEIFVYVHRYYNGGACVEVYN